MGYVNTVLCLLMPPFIRVQHDGPDDPLWMPVHAVPALRTGLAAFRSRPIADPLP